MLKGLRLPLMVFLLAAIFLSVALYVRFGGDSETPVGDDDVSVVTVTPTTTPTTISPTATTAPTQTPIPTVEDKLQPVPGQLTEGVVGRIGKLNPLYASFNPVDNDVTALIFEGLTTINEFGEIVPDLAERWRASSDGLDYIFALRRDALWHDGIPFTSADVKYTIDVMRSSDFQGDPALTEFWRTVEMTVVDDYTIRFRLVQPLASFPEHLRIGMLPQHVLEGYPVARLDQHPFNLDPIGTGPYQFETLLTSRGQIAAVVLRAAPVYRERQPGEPLAIDRLIIRTYGTPEEALAAYLAGEVNSVAHVPADFMPQLASFPHLALHTTVLPSVGMLIYNWQEDEIGYFTEQRARSALARALDPASLVSQTMGASAVVAFGPLIPGSWAYNAEAYPTYDPTVARDLLADVSFEREVEVEEEADEAAEEGGDEAPEETPEATQEGSEAASDETTSNNDTEESDEATPETQTITMRREFSILVTDRPELANLASGIAAQWNQLGFTVEVEAVDRVTFHQRLQAGDFDTAIVEYSFAPHADPDAYTFWHVGQAEDGLNYGGMRDLQISQALEKARRETIGINRVTFYDTFQELFAERVPAIPLYNPVFLYLVDDRLDGVQLGFITSPADRFRTIAQWEWQE
ncbi:MAG: ABC transporter substrate-binding protein [Chloroflexi bacterium]|nr:ABC transporter substrate-binding protein [Chloroflexota bacterium]